MNAMESSPAMIQIEKVLYTAKVHTTGGRAKGAARSSDGRIDIKLSTPCTAGTGTSPEQLFVAGLVNLFRGCDGNCRTRNANQRSGKTWPSMPKSICVIPTVLISCGLVLT